MVLRLGPEKTIERKGDAFTEMEASVTNERPSAKADIMGHLIGGLITVVTGFTVLLFSSLGYMDTMDEMKSLKEQAEEMGLGDIPGVNLEDTARFFLILLVIGGALLTGGIGLVTFALTKNRRGPGPRKSQ